jgi:hypothetical protein
VAELADLPAGRQARWTQEAKRVVFDKLASGLSLQLTYLIYRFNYRSDLSNIFCILCKITDILLQICYNTKVNK